MGKLSSAIRKRQRHAGEVAYRPAAIRNHCLECCGYDVAEVQRCTSPQCWLYPYRLGPGRVDSNFPVCVPQDAEKIYSAMTEGVPSSDTAAG